MKIYNNMKDIGNVKNFLFKKGKYFLVKLTGINITGETDDIEIMPVYRSFFSYDVGAGQLILEFSIGKEKSLIIHIYQYGIETHIIKSEFPTLEIQEI